MNAHLKYLNYVLRHKWYVFMAGIKLKVPFWQLLIHDLSKFSPAEWAAYVNYFNVEKTEQTKTVFDMAWNNHQKYNKHHWQHWLLITDSTDPRFRALPMPEKYIREMVADWCGAGKAITGKWEVAQWYDKSQHFIILEDNTRAKVTELVNSFSI